MSKKDANENSNTIKIVLPIFIILIVVGFLFWNIGGGGEDKKTSHQMADGVAKFYATFRNSFMPEDEELNEHTIKLPEPTKSVLQQLQERASIVRPENPNWKGATKRRSFKENDTLRNAITQYGEEEGVTLIWDLKYDYIIKHHFQEETSYTHLVERITKTVNNDYDGKVKSYFCPQERAVVVTAEETPYIQQYCRLTTSTRRLALDKKRKNDYQLRQKLGIN